MYNWITIIGGILTTVISGFCGWFFTKKRYYSEVKSNDLDNLQKTLDFYQELSDDTSKRLTEILAKNSTLEDQIDHLKEENNELKDMVTKQSKQIEELKNEIIKLSKAVNKIK